MADPLNKGAQSLTPEEQAALMAEQALERLRKGDDKPNTDGADKQAGRDDKNSGGGGHEEPDGDEEPGGESEEEGEPDGDEAEEPGDDDEIEPGYQELNKGTEYVDATELIGSLVGELRELRKSNRALRVLLVNQGQKISGLSVELSELRKAQKSVSADLGTVLAHQSAQVQTLQKGLSNLGESIGKNQKPDMIKNNLAGLMDTSPAQVPATTLSESQLAKAISSGVLSITEATLYRVGKLSPEKIAAAAAA